mmetsp:Transcript_14551/g.20430  ORF Transcript_14551/g.20430 Transcript_14551/m.20430 type:complete len:88 (-) Transcript_14551:1682-1945(-)
MDHISRIDGNTSADASAHSSNFERLESRLKQLVEIDKGILKSNERIYLKLHALNESGLCLYLCFTLTRVHPCFLSACLVCVSIYSKM